ncbi:response regulator transcription factor [Streptomyces sp. DSM 44917]|uniref:Response regulator transcription factor n=1 Tax=Streptomyces boetiae TaxID=3075541 RepID=A0ABU2L4L8_9ACTN|nr:response regulator transcription factor [Streptomyces sp. DSM 44917]MDT0306498.1 response regulator transcription factor [Streptomyces sp. DSM 44917]
MISVLVAGGAILTRELIVFALAREPDIAVVGEVGGGEEARDAVRRVRPDVMIVDAAGPHGGILSSSWLGQALADCRLLVIADADRLEALRGPAGAGATGLLRRNASMSDLFAAVRRAARGTACADRGPHAGHQGSGLALLTPREAEVLQIASKGHPAPHIAAELGLSVGTVRNYLTAVITKLNARNLVDAVRIAWESGWR